MQAFEPTVGKNRHIIPDYDSLFDLTVISVL